LDTGLADLRRAREAQCLEPQIFNVLENHERSITKDELLERVWGDKYITATLAGEQGYAYHYLIN
jgi:DNA-binding winged helix-turn-helix (wHTH) protein